MTHFFLISLLPPLPQKWRALRVNELNSVTEEPYYIPSLHVLRAVLSTDSIVFIRFSVSSESVWAPYPPIIFEVYWMRRYILSRPAVFPVNDTHDDTHESIWRCGVLSTCKCSRRNMKCYTLCIFIFISLSCTHSSPFIQKGSRIGKMEDNLTSADPLSYTTNGSWVDLGSLVRVSSVHI